MDRSPNVTSARSPTRASTPVGFAALPFDQPSIPAAVTSSRCSSAASSSIRTVSVLPDEGAATSSSQQGSPESSRVAAAARATTMCAGSGRCCQVRRSSSRAASAALRDSDDDGAVGAATGAGLWIPQPTEPSALASAHPTMPAQSSPPSGLIRSRVASSASMSTDDAQPARTSSTARVAERTAHPCRPRVGSPGTTASASRINPSTAARP